MPSVTRTRLFLAPLALAAAGSPLMAHDAQPMVELVAAEEEAGAFMGAALVAKGDELLLDKAFGSADLEWGVANTTDTKFRIGSVTKQFTAVAILMLHERGVIDVDKPVSTYLADAPAHWANVTVADLMHHTSGIPSITSFEDFRAWKFSPATLEGMIARFADKELEFEPGTKWNYSNSGYMLLAAIVEETSGTSLPEFMADNIFSPLGMSDTGVDVSETIIPHRASGYSPSEAGVVNAEYVHMSIPQGGGNIYSTTGDLLKWQRGLFGGKLLSPETLAHYTTPTEHPAFEGAGYADGVLVEEIDGAMTYWHGGGIEGFNSWLAYDPENEITVVVLANLNGGSARSLGLELLAMARAGTAH